MTAERWEIQTCWPHWSFLLTLTLSLKGAGTPDTQVSNPLSLSQMERGSFDSHPSRLIENRTN